MLKNIISTGQFDIWPSLSLLLFLGVFVAIVVWVFRKNSDAHYRHMAELTLQDQQPIQENPHVTKH